MPYLFACPHCQTKTQVDDRYSGQTGRCVTCGQAIQIPDFSDASQPSTGSRVLARPRSRKLAWFSGLLITAVLISLGLVSIFRRGRQTIAELQASQVRLDSITNLERIARAMQAYAVVHDTFPPPYSTDDSGNPLHSWRVLLLPFLGEEELYERFDLTTPWNSEHNLAWGFDMPAVYRHPNSAASGIYAIPAYYLITGKGTLFPPSGPLGPDNVIDGPAKTVLVVEAAPIGIQAWTEPHDLDFAAMRGQIGGGLDDDPGNLIEGGAAIVTVDGRGHFLRADSMSPRIFRALVTPRGREPLPDDVLDP